MLAFVMVSERSKCRVYFTVDFGIPDHIPDRLRASHSHREEYRGRKAGDCHILLSGRWNDQYNFTIPSRQRPTVLDQVEEK